MKVLLDKGAYEPSRAHPTDAGLDLRTPVDFTIMAHDSYTVDTGVHFEFPKGYYGKLESKSGLNVKHGVVCLGGTLDESYVGSVTVKLYNMSDEDYRFMAGDKVVQMILMPYIAPEIEYVDELEDTDRGSKGFGSSGR